ncbi:unnamed protein product [Paramecium primaurelia]|uniref:Uncharacterized protein n=1 Tax=Paramecium primaurelia TaxID=5886 RepID=A0A8S1NL42_PARPR|nr:unnamed protein product [Paramecium primaurelia]
MQYNIKEIIARLNDQRKTVQFRHRTLNSENSQPTQIGDVKRRLSTLDPPTMSMQYLELDVMKQKENKEFKKVTNKRCQIQNKQRLMMLYSKKTTQPQHHQSFLPLIDFSQLNNDPLPIVYPKHDKMIKLKKISSRVMESLF